MKRLIILLVLMTVIAISGCVGQTTSNQPTSNNTKLTIVGTFTIEGTFLSPFNDVTYATCTDSARSHNITDFDKCIISHIQTDSRESIQSGKLKIVCKCFKFEQNIGIESLFE